MVYQTPFDGTFTLQHLY